MSTYGPYSCGGPGLAGLYGNTYGWPSGSGEQSLQNSLINITLMLDDSIQSILQPR